MDYSELTLHENLQKGITEAGYVTCTPVQAQVLGTALDGSDLYVQSQTGTGKTAAYLVTIFQELLSSEEKKGKKALVMVPTRELAVQVEEEARKLGKYTGLSCESFYGGVGYEKQVAALKAGVDVIIGTPGRVIDLQEGKQMDLRDVAFLVVDEADRMFDMGFYPDLRKLIKVLPASDARQTMLFSATLNSYVKNLAWEYTRDAKEITIEAENITVDEIDQELIHVSSDEKMALLVGILAREKPASTIIFCNTKRMCEILSKRLKLNGIESEFIIGDLPQSKRLKIMDDFKAGKVSCLVATDVAARGIDVNDLAMVVNYDLPWAIIRLIQRAGRVDRIGQKAPQVYCYSFFPQEGINKVIRLRDRLNDRINANAETVGSDEVFFEGNKQNLEDIFNEKAGVLDEEDDGEVDLASQAFQIWESATKDNPALKERIQGLADVVYSTKPAGEYPPGVITYARTRSDSDVLVWLNADGGVASQSVGKIFAALACSAATPKLPPLENHHDLVTKAVASVKNVQSAAVGVLGSRSSTKYRIFTILQNRLKEDVLPLFEQNLKAAADQVYTCPMKETARNALGKMLQKRLPVDDIIQTVLEFHKDNELCIVPEDEDASPLAARIICSMGLAKEN